MPNRPGGISDSDVQAIRAIAEAHRQAVLDHNPDGYLDSCNSDLVFLPPRSACVDWAERLPRIFGGFPEAIGVLRQGSRNRWPR